MGKVRSIIPVKLITGVIAVSKDIIKRGEEKLVAKFGPIDGKSRIIPFDFTDYYNAEMGSGLIRQWLSFEKLIAPGFLADVKIASNRMEADISGTPERKINIDPGYLTMANLILASTKDFSHRIYMAEGIFAEVTLIYKNKEYNSLPWTYSDYKSAAATEFLISTREIYSKQLAAGKS